MANLYERDEKTFVLFNVFAGSLHFYWLPWTVWADLFVANQKRKEVGIRKVMGATVSSILILFSKEFVKTCRHCVCHCLTTDLVPDDAMVAGVCL